MFMIELFVLIMSAIFTYRYLTIWYKYLFSAWPSERSRFVRNGLLILPFVVFGIITYTLRVLASFDVVDDFFYITFYVLLGFAWTYLSINLMGLLFNISWIDDTLNMNNKATLLPVIGGTIGSCLIYSGANIGDGPGWWCVVFAGGLGLIAWFLLGMALDIFTGVFKRITVDREPGCGIRFGFYLISSGIILGRASGGDWTSFSATVIEFMAGWPALILTLFAIIIEMYYRNKLKTDYDYMINGSGIYGSVALGVIYIAYGVGSVFLLPPI